MFRKILCASDFTPGSDAALDLALDLGRRYDAQVQLLHVIESASASLVHGDLARQVALHEERAAVTRMLELVTGRQTTTPTRLWVRHGAPAEVTLQVAAELGVDLIVVGSHGRTGLARVFLGSVAEQISRRATCPVLLARPPAGA